MNATMTEKYNKVRYFASRTTQAVLHDISFLICTSLSIGLFIQMGNTFYTKMVFCLFAVSLESGKLYSLLKFKQLYSRHIKEKLEDITKKIFLNKRAIGYLLFYLGAGIISIIASLGFALVVLEAKSSISNAKIDPVEYKIEAFTREINEVEELIINTSDNIKTRQEKMNSFDQSFYGMTWVEYQSAFDENLKKEVELLDKYRNQRTVLEKQKLDYISNVGDKDIEVNPSSMFILMSNRLKGKVSPETIMFYLMLAFVLLLEILVVITSGTLPERDKFQDKEETKQKFHLFIDVLLKGKGKENRLNGLKKVSEAMNISYSEAKLLMDFILNIKYRKQPLLQISGSTYTTIHSSETLKMVIDYELNKIESEGGLA